MAIIMLLAGAAIPIFAAQAQEVTGETIGTDEVEGSEDIIITARKRDENVQDVPLTIAVLGGDTLAEQGVLRPSELQFAVPGFYVQNFETRATITLRGVGAQIAGGTSSVATHVNGVYQASSAAQLNRLFDVERVEVLKGPQGTLYGRNSTGGALNVITKAPGDTFSGDFSAGFGRFDTVRFDGAVSVPLSENFGARFAGSYLEGNGQFENIVNGRMIGNEDFYGGRVTLAGDLGPVEASIFAQYTRDRDNTQTTLIPIDPVTARPRFAWNQTVYDSPLEPEIDRKLFMAGMTLSGDFSSTLSWRSITGYLDYDDTSIIDVNPVVSPAQLVIQTPQQAEQFSQELHLLYTGDRFNGVLGGYYLSDKQSDQRFLTLDPPGLDLFDNASRNEIDAIAIFADANFDLTDQLTLNGGIRWNRDDIRNAFTGAGLIDGTSFDLSGDQTSVTWRAGLQYEFREGLMAFGSVSTGFQSGFFQTRTDALSGLDEPDRVDPEKLTAYEAGLKLAMAEGRGYFNISAFYYDYKDMQVSIGGVFLNPDGTLDETRPAFFFTQNAGKAEIYGVDVQLTDLRVASNLKFDVSAAYLHAQFVEYDTVDDDRMPISFAGNFLPRAPELSATASVTFDRLRLGASAEALLRLEYNYRSRAFFSPENERRVSQGPVSLVNANARIDFDDGRWAITAAGRNLTNERFFDFYGGSNFGNSGEFRTWEIGAAFRF